MTTNPDGSTTTTTVDKGGGTDEKGYTTSYSTKDTETKDKDGNLKSKTHDVVTEAKDGKKRKYSVSRHDKTKYLEFGQENHVSDGSDSTFDDNGDLGSVDTTHSDITYGANGHILKGEITTTHEDKNTGEKKETKQIWDPDGKRWLQWDPDKKAWVPKDNISLPIDVGGTLFVPTPGEDGGIASGTAALPPFVGAHGQLVFNVEPNSAEGGAQGVLVLTEDQQAHKRYFRMNPDQTGKVVMDALLVSDALRAISIVRRIDERGNPVVVSRCEVGNPSHIPGTDTLVRPPSDGPAITETSSSAQPGDVIQVHIARNDPFLTRFTLDGRVLRTLGVSNNSAVVQLPQNTTLATHQLVMESGRVRSNAVGVALVQLIPDPVGISQPGVVQTVTIHVNGLRPGQQAQMFFEIGGAAQMLEGGATATRPVVNGIVQLQVRGTQTGKALLRFHLKVVSPQFI